MEMKKNKLRIGILLDDNRIPLWKYKMLEQIVQSEHSEIVLAIRKDRATSPKMSNRELFSNRIKLLGFTLLTKIQKRFFRFEDDALSRKNISDLIKIPEIVVRTKQTKFSDYISEVDIEKIKAYNLDVLIRFGFRILRGDILNIARCGVWSYHHGNNLTNRGGPAGFWEVYEKRDETGVVLQRLTEDLDGGIVLSRGFYSTNKDSFFRNRNSFYWKSMALLPRELKKLYHLGEDQYFKKVGTNTKDPYFYDYPLYQAPSNSTVIKYVLKNFTGRIINKIRNKFYFEQWAIIYCFSSKAEFSTSLFRYKKILPPKDRFWADPFPYEREGKFYIFFEEYLNNTKKGHISVIEIDRKGNYSKPQIVLEKDYHLSYPFLYEENGELYMIPEKGRKKTVDVYKCIEFPLKWEFKKQLMNNIHAADSTIYKKDETYWLFCNIKENIFNSTHDELHLFYSDNLLSDNWVSHPQNPIISNVNLSRPAGNLFEINGITYRPSQGSAKTYGHHLNLNEVIVLNKTEYEEKTLQQIFPFWDKKISAIHTINNHKSLSVSDVQITRNKLF